MTDYYCDLSGNFVEKACTASGDPGVGIGALFLLLKGTGEGLFPALAAGDTCYIKGTGYGKMLVKITYATTDTSSWAISDVVQNYNDGGGTPGDDWTGKLLYRTATELYVQIDSGANVTYVSTADGVENTTRSQTIPGANMSAVACAGLRVETVTGGTSGFIRWEGTDSSWNTGIGPTYMAVFDCEVIGDTNSEGLLVASDYYLHYFKNIKIVDAADEAFQVLAQQTWFDHCWAYNPAAEGFYFNALYPRCFHCVSTLCVDGFYDDDGRGLFVGCRSYNNSNAGFRSNAGYSNIAYCLFYDNTGYGMYVAAGPSLLLHNVLEDNGNDAGSGNGIWSGTGLHIFALFSRIINNDAYGVLRTTSDIRFFEDYNYIYGNTTAPRSNVTAGPNSVTSGSDDGCEDSANNDYNVKSGAVLRSTAINLNWET